MTLAHQFSCRLRNIGKTYILKQELPLSRTFYAIMTGALEVIVDEEKIDKGNVVEKFKECRDILESEQDEIDVQHVLNCFQSIETIVNFDKKGRQKLPGFGEIICIFGSMTS